MSRIEGDKINRRNGVCSYIAGDSHRSFCVLDVSYITFIGHLFLLFLRPELDTPRRKNRQKTARSGKMLVILWLSQTLVLQGRHLAAVSSGQELGCGWAVGSQECCQLMSPFSVLLWLAGFLPFCLFPLWLPVP